MLKILEDDLAARMIDEGFALLDNPGIEIHHPEIISILESAGASVNYNSRVVSIPEHVAREALASSPESFTLHDLNGSPRVSYGRQQIHFNPGSSGLKILDSNSQKSRLPITEDYIKFIKLAETLPNLDAQSTALICSDVVEQVKDIYRLYLTLLYSRKPVVTGAFRMDSLPIMIELFAVAAGGLKQLKKRPLGIFDICPSSPLKWSQISSQNLLDCASTDIPIQIISMPMAGATAPVTIAAALVQHTAECLSGVIIAQLINKGCRVVWGGSPVIFDMRNSTTPMGAPGSWLISAASAQIGKSLGLPTQGYLGISDAKLLDAQCGMEAGVSTLLAAQTGFDMISGAGMLAFENCQSFEKLILDAELIGMVKHFLQGIQIRENPIAKHIIRDVGHNSDFLSHDHTLRWFKEEHYYPSAVIDRQPPDQWETNGSLTSWERAKDLVEKQISSYAAPPLDKNLSAELRKITTAFARSFDMDQLPPLPDL